MHTTIARCGNRCDLCPLFVQNFSVDLCDEINQALYRYHNGSRGTPPRYEKGCAGCLSEGYRAREDCPVRECAGRRGPATCADRDSLFCNPLEADMAVIEGAIARYAASVPPEDYDRYLRPFLIRETLSRLRQENSGNERLSLAD